MITAVKYHLSWLANMRGLSKRCSVYSNDLAAMKLLQVHLEYVKELKLISEDYSTEYSEIELRECDTGKFV